MNRLLCALLGALCLHATAAEPQRLDVLADLPEGAGPFPALVLAPGAGYHMALPALAQLAQHLAREGVAVYRFNWSYRASGGKASEDLALELSELQSVIALAKSEARVDAKRITVGGKSLGSIVAWRALQQDDSLHGALLLTPLCSRESAHVSATTAHPADSYYPGLSRESRPLALALGDRDPYCRPADLYAWLGQTSAPVRVGVVGGNHSFEAKTPTATAHQLTALLGFATSFMRP